MSIVGASPNYIAICYVWVNKCMIKVHQCCFIDVRFSFYYYSHSLCYFDSYLLHL